MDLPAIAALREQLQHQIGRVVVGQAEIVDRLLAALLCEGHVLLEGVPGTAKTLLARSFAACLSLTSNRIQFTPDLMPGDVIGTNLFDFRQSTFTLVKGALFTELLVADEINRTPPKTQAALLEAMQERNVTIDGHPNPLSERFMVVATQNPIEQQGTYPLPEAQLDRFLFKQTLKYPTAEEERLIVATHGVRTGSPDPGDLGVGLAADRAAVTAATQVIRDIRLVPDIVAYVVGLVRATRETPDIETGASPRSARTRCGRRTGPNRNADCRPARIIAATRQRVTARKGGSNISRRGLRSIL